MWAILLSMSANIIRGKLKESTAVGAELIGDDSIDADLEIISMVIDCMKKCRTGRISG